MQRLDTIPLELIELQADCFSGMYANQVITRPESIKPALAAIKDAGDPDHGTSQQRIAAFELGYKTGNLSECLSLTGGATKSRSTLQPTRQQPWR
jgi:predicted metalloprotease